MAAKSFKGLFTWRAIRKKDRHEWIATDASNLPVVMRVRAGSAHMGTSSSRMWLRVIYYLHLWDNRSESRLRAFESAFRSGFSISIHVD
jgi:hypothetical protein